MVESHVSVKSKHLATEEVSILHLYHLLTHMDSYGRMFCLWILIILT